MSEGAGAVLELRSRPHPQQEVRCACCGWRGHYYEVIREKESSGEKYRCLECRELLAVWWWWQVRG